MDLILHVGLSKTATTSLQNSVFPAISGYLGRGDLLGRSNRDGMLYKRFQEFCRGYPTDLASWTETIVRPFGDHRPDRILASQENLTNWPCAGSYHFPVTWRLSDEVLPPRRGKHPLARFLEEHVQPAWHGVGALKVLLSLRNQFDWLASRYAQDGNRNPRASQMDFARQVRRIIASEDAYLDYAALIDALAEAVGRKNLAVVLFEEFSTSHYWDELERFLGADLRSTSFELPRHNRRSSGLEWTLRPHDPSFTTTSSLIGRKPTHEDPRRWTLALLRHPRLLTAGLFGSRDNRISADDGLRVEVQAHFRTSNDRLSTLVGKQLSELGY